MFILTHGSLCSLGFSRFCQSSKSQLKVPKQVTSAVPGPSCVTVMYVEFCPIALFLWGSRQPDYQENFLLYPVLDFCSFCLQGVFGCPCLLMFFNGFLCSSLSSKVLPSQISMTHYEFFVFFIITKLMAEVRLGQATGCRAWGTECVRWEYWKV